MIPAGTERGRFVRLWGGTAASNLGDGVVLAAAPLLAAALTRDPLLVAGTAVAQQLPWFVFTLVAGVVVDRLDRRRLLVVANGVRAAALAALAVSLATGSSHLVVLYGVMFALGTAETIVDNAALAVLPQLVRRDRLEWANGRLFATQSVLNELVGPPLGGALFAVAATAAFCTGSVAFALAALLLALLPGPLRADRPADEQGQGVVGAIGAGLGWFWRHRLIRTLAFMAASVNFFGAATAGVLVLLAVEELGLGAGAFGLLLTAGAVGGIAAGLVADRVVGRLGSGPVIFLANALPALSCLTIALTSEPLLVGCALAVDSLAGTVGNVVAISLRQAAVPDHLLGRVASAYRLIALGALPLGALFGGAVADLFGLRAPFYAGAVCLALVALVLRPVLTTAAIDRAAGRTDRTSEEDVHGHGSQ